MGSPLTGGFILSPIPSHIVSPCRSCVDLAWQITLSGLVRLALNPCGLSEIGWVLISNKSKLFSIFSNPIQSMCIENNWTSLPWRGSESSAQQTPTEKQSFIPHSITGCWDSVLASLAVYNATRSPLNQNTRAQPSVDLHAEPGCASVERERE
jgi:hypothetical protein